MKKDQRQVMARLQRQGLVVRIEHSGKHLVLVLANGHRYTAAATPSDYRGTRNMECAIKRLCRLQPAATLQSPV